MPNTEQWYVGSVAGGHHKQVIQEGTGKTIALVYEPDETADHIVKSANVAPKLADALRRSHALLAEILRTIADKDTAREIRECKNQNHDALVEWDAKS